MKKENTHTEWKNWKNVQIVWIAFKQKNKHWIKRGRRFESNTLYVTYCSLFFYFFIIFLILPTIYLSRPVTIKMLFAWAPPPHPSIYSFYLFYLPTYLSTVYLNLGSTVNNCERKNKNTVLLCVCECENIGNLLGETEKKNNKETEWRKHTRQKWGNTHRLYTHYKEFPLICSTMRWFLYLWLLNDVL